MEYRIVNKPEFLVAGYELKTTSKEGKPSRYPSILARIFTKGSWNDDSES